MSMTIADIETSARQQYNAVGDSFFQSANIYNWLFQAQMILASRAEVIERIYTASTVASQQDYSYPTNTMAIKRITVNGKKISQTTYREDDSVTLMNAASLQTGAPAYYTLFNYTISLRPIPDSVYPINIYSLNLPNQVTATSTPDVPAEFHMDLVDYVLFRMFSQDKNAQMASLHKGHWEEHVKNAQSLMRRRKRADGFTTVQSEDVLPNTILGVS